MRSCGCSATARTATVRPLAADADPVFLHRYFEVFAAHAGQFHLPFELEGDDQPIPRECIVERDHRAHVRRRIAQAASAAATGAAEAQAAADAEAQAAADAEAANGDESAATEDDSEAEARPDAEAQVKS